MRLGYKGISSYISQIEHCKTNNRDIDKKLLLLVDLIDRIVTKFETKNPCIYKSLVGYRMLNRRGYPVVIKTGLCFPPFRAHAWLEVSGERFLYGDEPFNYRVMHVQECTRNRGENCDV